MARYQLRRPSPVKVFPRYARRQLPAASAAPAPEAEEEEEGPESPDSPFSSPSTVGALSEGEDSESEDEAEPPSPTQEPNAPPQGLPPAPTAESSTSFSLPEGSSEATSQTSALPALPVESATSATTTSTSTVTSAPPPAFTADFTSQGNNAALPQITGTDGDSTTTTQTSLTSTILVTSSLISTQQRPSSISSVDSSTSTDLPSPTSTDLPSSTTTDLPSSTTTDILSSVPTDLLSSITDLSSSTPTELPPSAQPENSGNDNAPQRQFPRPEPPIMTKGAAVAATVLGVLGALALIIGIVLLLKRRKRKQNAYNQQLADDAFDPSNTGTLSAPETAHVDDSRPLFFKFRDHDNHMTRSTERSNTLFGPGSYSRPETVSTERNNASRIPAPQPTPNPFADPPLNKAYDVLAGRPRSTTLTDRGSWIKNPFRNPDSERFDPFGELQEKARQERVRYLDEARREAELIREYEEQERQFKEKEKMGLTPDGLPTRKGSGVTVEGLGVLDRTGGGSYR